MAQHGDFLGNDAQKALLRRGHALHLLTRDNPAYTYYGRTVGLADMSDDALDRLDALTRLQGNSLLYDVPDADFPDLRAQCEARGFIVNPYNRWIGDGAAVDTARALLAATALPDDLTLVRLAPDTPRDLLDAFGDMALSCGVLPPALSVLTGASHQGLCSIAVDQTGRVVSCAAASALMHPDHPLGRTATWWGMLATDPSRRGERLSLILGADTILESHRRFGFTQFFTGVASGNAASEAVCTKLGLSRRAGISLTMAAPDLVPGGRMTS
jgi:hypothetical protein